MPVRYSQTREALHMRSDSRTQYERFKKYLLTEYQLKKNDYPRASSHPGRILVDEESIFHTETTQRRCTRCKQHYDNEFNPANSKLKPCFYHPKKRDVASGTYLCCRQPYRSRGCTRGKHHVSLECDLTKVMFKKTMPGRSKFVCNVFALDCEMVYTKGGLELAKVGIVGVDGRALYESFVIPETEILDYNTEFSGVTSIDLMSNAVPFSVAQEIVLGFVTKDSILVGHGLENDLRALRLIHGNVVDTSVLFPHEHSNCKRSLKSLAAEFLNKIIQIGAVGHSCIEDARTAMELAVYKIDLDLLPASSAAEFRIAQTLRGLDQASTSSSIRPSASLNLHGSRTSDAAPLTDQLFIPDSNPARATSMNSQREPEPVWTGGPWHQTYTSEDAEPESHRQDEEDPRMFVTDESDSNMWNMCYLPEEAPVFESCEEIPMDILFRSISYTQQFLIRSNLMDVSTVPTIDTSAMGRCRVEPPPIESSSQSNLFGVTYKGEWYPIHRTHVMLASYGNVEA